MDRAYSTQKGAASTAPFAILGVVKGPQSLKFIPALTACTSKRMKTGGFRTLRVLPPGGPPQRVSSGPFPGAEPHVYIIGKNRKKTRGSDRSHFRETKLFDCVYKHISDGVGDVAPLYLNVCPGAAGGVAPNYHPVAGVQVKDLCAGGAGRGVDPRLVVG